MQELNFYSDHIIYDFIGAVGSRLFVSRHLPKKATKNMTIIFLNPIFEERSRGHRYIFNWSRILAEKGYEVVRFDYYGQGDSDGEVRELSVESNLDDISRIYDWARNLAPGNKIAIHGLRWGATMGALWDSRNLGKLSHLLLWEPIVDSREYIMGELRMNLTTQLIIHKKVIEDRKALTKRLESGEPVNIDGYHLSPRLWNHIDAATLANFKPIIPSLIYKFIKLPRNNTETGPVNYPLKESLGKITSFNSPIPTFFLEVPDYSNFNKELFQNSLNWIEENERDDS